MDLNTLTVADLMTTDLKSADASENLRAAAAQMTAHGIHCLMVPAEDPAKGIGIITCKDIVRILGDAPAQVLDELTVGEAMTHPAITIPAYLCVADAIRLMSMTGVRQAFVLSGQEPVGLISFTDIMRAVAEEKPSE